MPAANWYVWAPGHDIRGPFTLDQLAAMIERNELKSTAKIRIG
jgi:hypothetical protein